MTPARSEQRSSRSVTHGSGTLSPDAGTTSPIPSGAVTLSHTWTNVARSGPVAAGLPSPAPLRTTVKPVKAGWFHVTPERGVVQLWRLIKGGSPCDAPKKGSCLVSAAGSSSLQTADSITLPAAIPLVIIPEDSPAMQTPHPLDLEVDEMDDTHRAMVRLFASDGQIDDQERFILDRFTNHYTDISGYRMREVAADAFKRNGHTDLTGRRFADAGYKLVDLEAERKSRPGANVISFPTHRDIG